MKITYFQRKQYPGAYSIERLDCDIQRSLSSKITLKARTNRYYSRGILPRLLDSLLAIFHQSDINHITGDIHYISYFLQTQRTILTIHDCEMLSRTSGLKHWILWFFWFWLAEKNVVSIVAISETTKKKILEFLECKPEKITVINNPVSSEFTFKHKTFNKQKPRILHIGTKENKNLERVIKALENLEIVLVIVGKLQDRQINLLKKFHIDYENLVQISNKEMIREYELCDLLVFASTEEGFGLPILEAQSTGRVVVTSATSSMPEVAGTGAIFVNPYEITSIREGICQAISDDVYREKLITLGKKNVEKYKIENISHQYLELYNRVYSNFY